MIISIFYLDLCLFQALYIIKKISDASINWGTLIRKKLVNGTLPLVCKCKSKFWVASLVTGARKAISVIKNCSVWKLTLKIVSAERYSNKIIHSWVPQPLVSLIEAWELFYSLNPFPSNAHPLFIVTSDVNTFRQSSVVTLEWTGQKLHDGQRFISFCILLWTGSLILYEF